LEAPLTLSLVLKTPRSSKSIRHFQADYRKNLTAAKLEKLFKANEELATQAALDRHTKEGLLESLKIEKKNNRRGKRLNVLGKENNGPILFSAEVVREAQAIAEAKEQKEKAERARIDGKKVAFAIKKAQKEAERQEKALQAATREGNRAEVVAEEKAEKQAQKKKKASVSKASKDLLAKAKSPAKPRKAPICKKKVVRFVGGDSEEVVPALSQKRTLSGRTVKTPIIFEKGI